MNQSARLIKRFKRHERGAKNIFRGPKRRQYTSALLVPTHRELHLIVLITGYKRPPALDPLLFEDGDGGQLLLVSDHVKGTLLGRLGATGKPV